jgi:hypothetical protein
MVTAKQPIGDVRWWQGWAPLVILPPIVLLSVPSGWPKWVLMWALAFAVYLGCKWVTWRRTPISGAPAWKHAAYLTAWPGLDATRFLAGNSTRSCCRSVEWFVAGGRLMFGAALLFGVVRMIPAQYSYAIGWMGMIGLLLILHFGLFHLLSCGWRSVGVEARPLVNRPLAATSLSEFWGRRWNMAFRDLAHRFLFRPFTSWLGPRAGIIAGFLFSGAVHDLVISVPSEGGYGGPTTFFAVQGAAIMVERSVLGRRIGLGSGSLGRLFTILVLILPVGLLFHRPFVVRIIVPFMRALGAL